MPRLHQTEPMHTKVNRKQAEGLLPQNHLLHSLISTTHLQMIHTVLQSLSIGHRPHILKYLHI